MKISELIAALEALKAEHGDIPVALTDDSALTFMWANSCQLIGQKEWRVELGEDAVVCAIC